MKAKTAVVPSVDSRPFMVVRPYGEPQYRASFKSAQDLVLRDLLGLKKTYQDLRAEDSLLYIEELEQVAKHLPESGGHVAGVIDETNGLKYRAEIRKRVAV